MNRPKKIFLILTLLAGGLAVYFAQANFAQDASFGNLQFSVDGGKIYFFQPETGKIFVYQTTTNRFSRLLSLEKLGEDLKQSRSVPDTE